MAICWLEILISLVVVFCGTTEPRARSSIHSWHRGVAGSAVQGRLYSALTAICMSVITEPEACFVIMAPLALSSTHSFLPVAAIWSDRPSLCLIQTLERLCLKAPS